MNDRELVKRLWELALPQRWFSGRAGEPVGVELGDWAQAASSGVGLRPAILQVKYEDDVRDSFLIPLLYRGSQPPIDACDDAGLLLELLAEGAPGFRAERVIPSGLKARRFTGEQSNTSIFFGDEIVAKVFRRIEPGPNCDIELHRALQDTSTVARLYGTWSGAGSDYAVFFEALPHPEDGYQLACRAAETRLDFSAAAAALGSALAEIHHTLASAFPTDTVSGDAVAAQCRLRFTAAAAQVPQLTRFQSAAAEVFDSVSEISALPTQRIHGDCHLGQVLRSENRWVYVDFEGEPLKSLAERRLPDSPLRDVAGVLRSFGYAAASGGADRGWLADHRSAFLAGYGLDPAQSGTLLAAFEIDKAGYEVTYEARYRPHLMRVPLDFLAALGEGAN